MRCNINSTATSQIISFDFVFQPSLIGSYVQHHPAKWVVGRAIFPYFYLHQMDQYYPIIGCIMTLHDSINGGATLFNLSGSVLNISGLGWRLASLIEAGNEMLNFNLEDFFPSSKVALYIFLLELLSLIRGSCFSGFESGLSGACSPCHFICHSKGDNFRFAISSKC